MTMHADILAGMIEEKRAELDQPDAPRWNDAIARLSDFEKAIGTKDPAKLSAALAALKSTLHNGKGNQDAEITLRKLIQEHAKIAKAKPADQKIIDEILVRVVVAIEAEVTAPDVRERISRRLGRPIPEVPR